jgi:hypothetical protein
MQTNEPWFDNLESEIEIHKDQPIFDGQYPISAIWTEPKMHIFH